MVTEIPKSAEVSIQHLQNHRAALIEDKRQLWHALNNLRAAIHVHGGFPMGSTVMQEAERALRETE